MHHSPNPAHDFSYYLNKSARLLNTLAEIHLRNIEGLTLSQFLYLLSLDDSDGTHLTQQNIAESLGIDKAAVSRQTERLIRKGWLMRSTTTRRSAIKLTDKGKTILHNAKQVLKRETVPLLTEISPATVQELQYLSEQIENKLVSEQ